MVWLENLPDDWWKPYQSSLISPQCIQELNIELLFLVRSLLLETRTYTRVCKRTRLLTYDFQNALDARNIHRSINSTNKKNQSEESIISISSIIQQTDQCLSNNNCIQLRIHWLAIDGEQPIIPENPLPNFNEDNSSNKNSQITNENKKIPFQLIDQSPLLKNLFTLANSTSIQNYETQNYVHPLTKNNLTVKPIHSRNLLGRRSHTNHKISLPLPPSPSSLAHELSIEQQLYFKSLTESCFNENDEQSIDAFHCFASDAALQPLLPRLLLFISKGIQTNIYLNDLNFILQFLSILKTLTTNTYISFDKYLHTIIPSLLTCLVCLFDLSKSSLDQINSNNYSTIWLMREQASDLLSYFEKQYSFIPYFTQRICSIIKSNLINNIATTTTTTYSIVYACIRTLFLIDIQMYGSFVIDILRNYKKTEVFVADFDLDAIEQQTLFDQKINELFEKYDQCNDF